jgi:4-amino-4-deoxy-L-arabinose transferase-like glycosyltransferase
MPPVFATGWYEVPALSFAIPAASMAIFGDNLFGLRLASVIQGMLSVALLYLLARRLWGPRPALLAAALMAIAAWHIHFSRTGFHYMQAPVATLLVLLFLMRGLDSRRLLDFVLCGFALGLCFEVYWAARLAPILVGLCLAYRFLVDRQPWRRYLPGLAALALGTLAFLAPMAVVYARSPGSFGSRALGVLVTSPANLQHELDGYHVDTLSEVLAIQTQRTLESFNIRGETSLQYGHPGPLLDPWTGGLLAIGALATLRLGSMRRVLLASWIWLTLLFGSVLTVDALFSPHVLVALPALALAAALVLESAWRGLTRLAGLAGTYAFALPVLAVLGLALQANVHDYFDVQTVERQPAGRFTLLASYVQTLDERYRLYVIGRDDWTFNFETTRFLVPNPDAVDVRNEPLALPLDRIPSSKGVAFLVENAAPDYAQRLDAIRQAYPTGHAEVIAGGAPVFTSYLVENPDLARANPGAARD